MKKVDVHDSVTATHISVMCHRNVHLNSFALVPQPLVHLRQNNMIAEVDCYLHGHAFSRQIQETGRVELHLTQLP